MPLNQIQPYMTSGVLKTENNLSEVQASLDTAYTNIGLNMAVPVGCVFPYAGSTAPTGWLFCNGQAVSRTVESQLFAVLGTTYGAGNGTTTFNLPDLRGRVIIGKDTSTGSADRVTVALDSKVLGAAGGAEDIGLTNGDGMAENDIYWSQDGNNVQPSIVLNYIIRSRLSGLAP
jgi:microcystin-dependent protein